MRTRDPFTNGCRGASSILRTHVCRPRNAPWNPCVLSRWGPVLNFPLINQLSLLIILSPCWSLQDSFHRRTVFQATAMLWNHIFPFSDPFTAEESSVSGLRNGVAYDWGVQGCLVTGFPNWNEQLSLGVGLSKGGFVFQNRFFLGWLFHIPSSHPMRREFQTHEIVHFSPLLNSKVFSTHP